MDPHKNPDPYGVELDDGKTTEAPIAKKSDGAGEASKRFNVGVRGNVQIITFSSGEVLDPFEIETLRKELGEHVNATDIPNLVFDMANIRLLSSAALGMLVSLKSQAEAKGGGLHIAGVQGDLKKVFKLTKLHKVLKMHKDVDAAAKGF